MHWLDTEIHRKYHETSALFPLMEGPDFEALKSDIAANGLREAIWLHPDGSIIDGRNRHRACIETENGPRFRTWDGQGSLVAFVVSMNLHRRHLTSSQRAMIGPDILPMLEKEAEEQRRKNIGMARSASKSEMSQIFEPSQADRTSEVVARILQTNRQYVSDAKAIRDKAPDLADQVRSGEKTIPQAKREITKRERAEAPPMPSEKYRVFYVDPPWRYGNKGLDNYGHAERHYPTMSIEELCVLPIKELAEDNAVLFLWVTSPLLEECFEVIRVWGFKYKSSFVWDKVKHNFGYYNSVRHEFLLVCTRGSCTPDSDEKIDSVQTIERSNKHSEKPEAFRAIIDRLYTRGRRIELFARKAAEGWDTWGNEPEPI